MPLYNIQITKTPELRFRAVLGDGAREVCLEWGDRVSIFVEEAFSEVSEARTG